MDTPLVWFAVSIKFPARNKKEGNPMTLTVVIPAHNEANNIEKCIYQILHTLPHADIYIAEDGSTDTTPQIAATLASLFPQITTTHFASRLGKGEATRRAIQQASPHSTTILIMDADLATDLNATQEALWTLKAKGGLIIGSRTHPQSHTTRTKKRALTSWMYNTLVRHLFRDGIRDHQCGFKLLSPETYEIALYECNNTGFLYDTELIIQCKRFGLNVTEIPVTWEEQTNTKVQVGKDGIKMFIELLKLRWKLK
jgi:glycosyltransferase AglD